MTEVLIALGSNVGDALSYLQQAVDHLAQSLQDVRTSAVYETAPMYVTDQPRFLNAAISAKTDLGPLPLLHYLKETEQAIGRHKGIRFGPREIDIDLIAYGHLKYKFQESHKDILDIPHPRVKERRFVLEPLNDLNPDTNLAGLGKVKSLVAATEDQRKDVIRQPHAVLSIHGSR
jgi:2-amino-4-hydroxy-6-hydroxymethyldihydropteridine diphosphokinase